MLFVARTDLGTAHPLPAVSRCPRFHPYLRLPVPIRASRSATLPSRPSAPARPAPWETVLGLLKKARAVFHGATGRAALPRARDGRPSGGTTLRVLTRTIFPRSYFPTARAHRARSGDQRAVRRAACSWQSLSPTRSERVGRPSAASFDAADAVPVPHR